MGGAAWGVRGIAGWVWGADRHAGRNIPGQLGVARKREGSLLPVWCLLHVMKFSSSVFIITCIILKTESCKKTGLSNPLFVFSVVR